MSKKKRKKALKFSSRSKVHDRSIHKCTPTFRWCTPTLSFATVVPAVLRVWLKNKNNLRVHSFYQMLRQTTFKPWPCILVTFNLKQGFDYKALRRTDFDAAFFLFWCCLAIARRRMRFLVYSRFSAIKRSVLRYLLLVENLIGQY